MNESTQQADITLADVSNEVVVTIRCLSAIPEEVEALLAEIAKQDYNQLKAENRNENNI